MKYHTQSDDRVVRGNKFVHLDVRGEDPHARVMLDVAHVADEKGKRNSEADWILSMTKDITERLPGVQSTLTDTVLRGVHIDQLQRERGLIVIDPVTAKAVDKKTGERTEKDTLIDHVTFDYPDSTTEYVAL